MSNPVMDNVEEEAEREGEKRAFCSVHRITAKRAKQAEDVIVHTFLLQLSTRKGSHRDLERARSSSAAAEVPRLVCSDKDNSHVETYRKIRPLSPPCTSA